MVIHSKVRIECGSKDCDPIWQWNNCASYAFTGIEPGRDLTRWDMPKLMETDLDGLRAIPSHFRKTMCERKLSTAEKIDIVSVASKWHVATVLLLFDMVCVGYGKKWVKCRLKIG